MSGQKQVDRHRVRLTHKVEESGAVRDVEIPFVMGVLMDGSGNHPDAPGGSLDDAAFTDVTSDSFDRYLEKCAPRLRVDVPNRLSEDENERLVADIEIRGMKDFSPDAIASRVPGLKEVYEARNRLESLLRHLESSRSAKKLLDGMLDAETLAGLDAGAAKGGSPAKAGAKAKGG